VTESTYVMANNMPSSMAGLEGWDQMEASLGKTVIERRTKARYPVKLTVRYRTIGRSNSVNGVGQTLNMSSGGLLVSAEHEMPAGLRLEVNVEWPLLLDGTVPLQLVAHGKVVRGGGSEFAISFAQYQFRTMGRVLKANGVFDSDPLEHLAKRFAGA
jgi:PilZ domain